MHRAVRSIAVVVIVLLVAAAAFLLPRRSAPLTTVEELRRQYGLPQSRYVDVAGVTVHYTDEGSGPALLLVHGSFGSLRTWDELVPVLASRYRVIRYDQPPGGLSGPVGPDFRLTSEQFLREFLARLAVQKVAIAGTSSGGIIAYRYAATFPDDVTALVLTNIPPSAPVDNAGARGRTTPFEQLSSVVCGRYANPWSRTCWRDFLGSMFVRDERVTDALVTQYYDLNRHPGARQFTSMTAIMKDDAKVRDFLARVRAPTLLVWTREDPVLPPKTAQTLASRLTATRTETVWLENVSHYPPLEAPQEVAAAASEFLARVLAAPAGGPSTAPPPAAGAPSAPATGSPSVAAVSPATAAGTSPR
jgi:pimeloyl-ACP methyl ester carboxylesterase